jgi:aspartate racemase
MTLPEFPKTSGTIGIIGGAGVAASAELMSRLEQNVTALGAFRDSQHPEVLLYQATQVPSRSMYLEGRGESFIPGYVEAATKLKNAGASFLAMCCNTAHFARADIAEQAGITIIDMIAESLYAAVELVPAAKKVGIMCSDGTRASRLYEVNAPQTLGGVEFVYPDPEFQAMVTAGICNIKKGLHRSRESDDGERPWALYCAAADNLVGKGVEVIVLACTEIPLDFDPTGIAVPCIDTIQVLADTCISIASGTRAVER